MELEKAIENRVIKFLKCYVADDEGVFEVSKADLKLVLNINDGLGKELKKQDKMIDKMVHWISDRCLYVDDYSNSCDVIQDSCYEWQCGKDCRQCIKQYFEKKAEEAE